MLEQINKGAEFCGRVPLNQTNLIQPHGYLLIVDREHLRILQVSENVTDLFQTEVSDLINKSLSEYMPLEQLQHFTARMGDHVTGRLPFIFSFPVGQHLVTVKQQDFFYIIEVEKEKRTQQKGDAFLDVYNELKYAMAAVDAAKSTSEACQIAIRELKAISGFDKIMIYQFDENWNGDVIAEVMEPGMESYLGLKFPASDIPRQARELYKKSPFRLIPNIHYNPVRLYPVINPVTNAFTDLSDSNLRSVAGVHLEYLQNMNIKASMSTRILKDNQLWGLIACHHREARYLSFELCSVFELLSTIISSKIALVQSNDSFDFRARMQDLNARVIENVYKKGDFISSFTNSDNDLLQLLSADGVAISLDHQIEVMGTTPEKPDVEDLIVWLQANNINKLYHQPCLSSVYEQADMYCQAGSGILALPISPEKGMYIVAFRSEAVQKVNWGGNPNESVQFETGSQNYHPRNSFSLWQQTVVKTSLSWKEEELRVAEQFRNFVIEFTLNKIYS